MFSSFNGFYLVYEDKIVLAEQIHLTILHEVHYTLYLVVRKKRVERNAIIFFLWLTVKQFNKNCVHYLNVYFLLIFNLM